MILLLGTPFYFVEAASKSQADIQRDAIMQKSREEREAKIVIERKENEDRIERKKIKEDPQFHYECLIKGRFALWNGTLVPFVKIRGVVDIVLDDQRVLLERISRIWLPGEHSKPASYKENFPAKVVAVLSNTVGIVDGTSLILDNLCDVGTYKYDPMTFKEFRKLEPISYDDFLILRNSGKLPPSLQ